MPGIYSPVYNVWRSIKSRCFYTKNNGFKLYGGRGISMCDEWKNNFDSFEKFCMENGWEKGKQIDRIDNNGNYCPGNCRFVLPKENARNRSTNKFIEYNDMKLTYSGWAEYIGISKETFKGRIKKGISIGEIIRIGKRGYKEFGLQKRKSPVFNMSIGEEIIVKSKKEKNSIYSCGFAHGIKIKTRKFGNEYKLIRIS